VQNEQRRASMGISLRHSGHLRVLGSGVRPLRMREVSALAGLTTNTNRAIAEVQHVAAENELLELG
jgi:hypothetical protein